MKNEKVKNIIYWVVTALLAANYAFGGISYIMQGEQVVAGMTLLGYPLYFAVILGIWKILGSIVLVAPRLPLLKEWTYAGILFNLTAASASNAIRNPEIAHAILPLVMLVFAAVSWYLRPASRKFAGLGI